MHGKTKRLAALQSCIICTDYRLRWDHVLGVFETPHGWAVRKFRITSTPKLRFVCFVVLIKPLFDSPSGLDEQGTILAAREEPFPLHGLYGLYGPGPLRAGSAGSTGPEGPAGLTITDHTWG